MTTAMSVRAYVYTTKYLVGPPSSFSLIRFNNYNNKTTCLNLSATNQSNTSLHSTNNNNCKKGGIGTHKHINQIFDDSHKLVLEVKERLKRDYHELPLAKNGRDDEQMIHWFLKDREFSVDDAIKKLTKAIKWRQEFGVSNLSEDSVEKVAETGKAYVHDYLDVNNRPVLIVVASKHIPLMFDPIEDEKLCVFMIEKALSKLPEGKEDILGIVDLRGFGTKNADLKFLTFLFDVFYYYYPKRLGQVLFIDAPFVFKPFWQIAKPLLKSYASLVRFCSVKNVQEDYFTVETLPLSFRD